MAVLAAPRAVTKETFCTVLIGSVQNDKGGRSWFAEITDGQKRKKYYLIDEIPCDWGWGFHFRELGNTSGPYQVSVARDQEHGEREAGQFTCTCKGFSYKGWCKHVSAALNLAIKTSGE